MIWIAMTPDRGSKMGKAYNPQAAIAMIDSPEEYFLYICTDDHVELHPATMTVQFSTGSIFECIGHFSNGALTPLGFPASTITSGGIRNPYWKENGR